MKRFVGGAMISAALLIPAIQAEEGKIRQRKERQQQRIANGIKNGTLSPKEAANLENKEHQLNVETRDMREDHGGKLTPKEKSVVNRQQNRVSRQIYRDKHDVPKQ